jgi:pyruvate/2-oxoglutarate/acetoin dehydrogenase E1 component
LASSAAWRNAFPAALHKCLEAARLLQAEGISAEVVDLKTLYPLDWDTILASAAKTGRVVVAHETWRFLGPGAEIAATLAERLWDQLEAPVLRVGAAHVPIPFSPPLEKRVIPQVEDILKAAKEVLAWR